MIEQQDVLFGLLGTGVAGVALRAGITWMGRQGMIQTGDNSQKELIERLSSEAAKWQAIHAKEILAREEDRIQHAKDMDTARQQHNDNLILLGETRAQNKMLRMLLIQRGMSSEELDKALEIDDVQS